MTLPRDISTEGWRIDRLLEHTGAMVAVIASVVAVWLAVVLWRGVRRRRPEPATPLDRQHRVPVAVAVLFFAVVCGYLLFFSSRDRRGVFDNTRAVLAEPGVVRVEIAAHQWAWSVRYPGPDGRFATADDPISTNELRVPVDTPVVIQLAATDVVHGLFIPGLRIKHDAIPGRIAELWFEATELGRFEIACSQFCGASHYRMAGVVVVETGADFSRWVDGAASDSIRIAAEAERAARDEPAAVTTSPSGHRDWGWPWEGRP